MSDPLPQRRTLRLKDYDYTQANAYFVTLCTYKRIRNLSAIAQGNVHLTQNGQLVEDAWNQLPEHYADMILDAFIIMPDHAHGIVILPENCFLANVIGSFKSASARLINLKRGESGIPIWQRGYYEHVIRDEADLAQKRLYITGNPGRWTEKYGR